MQTQDTQANQAEEISIEDIANFIKEEFWKISISGLLGILLSLILGFITAQYQAKLIYTNYSGIDILRLKTLQASLPKLYEEVEKNKSQNDFLKSEKVWETSVKPNILIKKADGKDLLDVSALIKASNSIPTIEIIGFGTTKAKAIQNVETISNFFINGSSYLQLRDLIRNYDLRSIAVVSNAQKKVSALEIESVYLEKRIKNLNSLKNQFPNAINAGSQVVDAKDSGAKYLPISTQIIAATTDLNGIQEQLARLRDEESQVKVYSSFADSGKKILTETSDPKQLIDKLLIVIEGIQKSIPPSNTIQVNAAESIKVDLKSIQTDNLYGLRQIGEIDVSSPKYIKYLGIGLFAGLMFGFMFSIALRLKSKFF
jgi:hypothetical protein